MLRRLRQDDVEFVSKSGYIQRPVFKNKQNQISKMAGQVKVLFAKTKSLSSDPRIHKVEEKHLLPCVVL